MFALLTLAPEQKLTLIQDPCILFVSFIVGKKEINASNSYIVIKKSTLAVVKSTYNGFCCLLYAVYYILTMFHVYMYIYHTMNYLKNFEFENVIIG